MTRARLISLFAAALVVSSGCSRAGGTSHTDEHPGVESLATDRCYFFESPQVEEQEFLAFIRGGAYLRTVSRSTGVLIRDTGSWSQSADGMILLKSDSDSRDIEVPPFTIAHPDVPNVLPKMEKALHDLLSEANVREYSMETIRKVFAHSLTKDPELGFLLFDPKVATSNETIPRARLEELLRAVQGYSKSPAKNVFTVTPFTYHGHAFLEWRDSGTPLNRDRDAMMRAIDERKDGAMPLSFFTDVPQESYERDAARGPFVAPALRPCKPQ